MASQSTTIQSKLMMAIMGTSIIVLLAACTGFISYEVITFRRNLVRSLETRGQLVAANSTAALAFRNREDATQILSTFSKDPRMEAACLYDQDGRIFATYPTNGPASMFPSHPASGSRFEKGACFIFIPVVQGDQWLGMAFLRFNLSTLRDRYRAYTVLVMVIIAGSVLISFLFSKWMQKRIAEPILSLAEMAHAVSERKDYALRAQKLSSDEIGVLTDAFNNMLGEIQRGEGEIRQLNKELEQRVIERTAELEASNKELEAFSYSVSHDLRAPLRGIDGFSQSLLEDYGGKLDGEGRRQLERVRLAAQRMAQLIDDLLKLSRLGRTEIHREWINLSAVARQIAAELKRSQPERNVSFLIEEELKAQGDAHLLYVAIDNLLRNAWKYTSKHPTARIEVGSNSQNGQRVFYVRDDGAGFDMAHANLLFVPFQRLHRQSDFEGTGVGLATVQRIIRRHGGRLWAEGVVEKGATFYFTL